MEVIEFQPDAAGLLASVPTSMPSNGWLWLALEHSEWVGATDRLVETIHALTGVRLFDLHVQDAANLAHPSFFDATQDYRMVVFRKLLTSHDAAAAAAGGGPEVGPANVGSANSRRALQQLATRPITFFVLDRLLVTVRSDVSRTIDQLRQRVLAYRPRENHDGGEKQRLPARPEELMLRLLNGMVDRYLDLRQPLTAQLDRWQRELLDPRRPFDNWSALLDARNEVRKLEYLCEEQYDALQELRDNHIETDPLASSGHADLVRIADVMEHINRVLNHARRLEASIETAVQLHFSAVSHRTSQIVQTLTVITAIFAPLSLITGIFGMNFEAIPGLRHPFGFWITIGTMCAIASVLLGIFLARRYLNLGRSR